MYIKNNIKPIAPSKQYCMKKAVSFLKNDTFEYFSLLGHAPCNNYYYCYDSLLLTTIPVNKVTIWYL